MSNESNTAVLEPPISGEGHQPEPTGTDIAPIENNGHEEDLSDLSAVQIDINATGEMSMKEARAIHENIKRCKGAERILVYLMCERQGWKKLGYSSFEVYAREFLEVADSTAYDWVKQVKISIESQNVKPAAFLPTTPENERKSLLPTSATRHLSKLETPKLRKQAYKEAKELTKDDAEPGKFAANIKNIVDRMLAKPPAPSDAAKAQPSKTAATASEPNAPGQDPEDEGLTLSAISVQDEKANSRLVITSMTASNVPVTIYLPYALLEGTSFHLHK